MSTNNPKSSHKDLSLPDYKSGIPVIISIEGQDTQGIFSHWTKLNEAYIKVADKPYWRKPNKFRVIDSELVMETNDSLGEDEEQITSQRIDIIPAKQFDINKRFEFLASLTRMVLKKQQASLIVTGDGGLGKTFTVIQECSSMDLKEYGLPSTEGGEYRRRRGTGIQF